MMEWPPRQSASEMQDGEMARGSTGQLFIVKNHQWVRATKSFEDEMDIRITEMKSQRTDAEIVRNIFVAIGVGFAVLVVALLALTYRG